MTDDELYRQYLAGDQPAGDALILRYGDAPQVVTVVVEYADAKFTFDLGGGETLTKWYFSGQAILLPEPLAREGYLFAG